MELKTQTHNMELDRGVAVSDVRADISNNVPGHTSPGNENHTQDVLGGAIKSHGRKRS